MSLRNQPYLPLYVQDYLTDEKLNLCSWSTQGIYIKILCVLHKQEEYGCILFKQNSKQNLSTCLDFASILVRQIPCQLDEMESAISELVDNGVLQIDGNKLMQKRMVKDNSISIARSNAAKKGGGNPNLFKQKPKQQFKQKDKQIPEYEIVYDNEYVFNVFNTWLSYKRDRGEKYKTSQSAQVAYNNLVKYSGNNPEMAKTIVERSIGNNWAGLFELDKSKNGQKDNPKANLPKHLRNWVQ